MSRFTNAETGVVVSVADHKDNRFGEGWVSSDSQPSPVKRVRSKKSATPDVPPE